MLNIFYLIIFFFISIKLLLINYFYEYKNFDTLFLIYLINTFILLVQKIVPVHIIEIIFHQFLI